MWVMPVQFILPVTYAHLVWLQCAVLHPTAQDLRCSAMRTLLRAAHCLRRIRPSKHFVSFAARTPLWAARCLRRIRQPKHFVSLAVRAPLWAARCRVASDCPRPSLLCNA